MLVAASEVIHASRGRVAPPDRKDSLRPSMMLQRARLAVVVCDAVEDTNTS
jgi:hypothetical protein